MNTLLGIDGTESFSNSNEKLKYMSVGMITQPLLTHICVGLPKLPHENLFGDNEAGCRGVFLIALNSSITCHKRLYDSVSAVVRVSILCGSKLSIVSHGQGCSHFHSATLSVSDYLKQF